MVLRGLSGTRPSVSLAQPGGERRDHEGGLQRASGGLMASWRAVGAEKSWQTRRGERVLDGTRVRTHCQGLPSPERSQRQVEVQAGLSQNGSSGLW